MMAILEGLTLWHWIGLGVILLTIEVAVGTFDLLWVALAAFVTAFFAFVLSAAGWQGQLVVFFLVSTSFVILGRTVFKGLRRTPSTHPLLNDKLAQMKGHRGEAITSFDGEKSEGRVKIGDTVWQAVQVDDALIVEGDEVVVTGADGATLKIKLS